MCEKQKAKTVSFLVYMKLFTNDKAEVSAQRRQHERQMKTLTDQYLRLPSTYFNTGF